MLPIDHAQIPSILNVVCACCLDESTGKSFHSKEEKAKELFSLSPSSPSSITAAFMAANNFSISTKEPTCIHH